MAGLPDTFAGAVLDFITNRGGAATYLTLLNADPGSDPVMVSLPEIPDVGYARQLVTYKSPLASPPGTANATMQTFGPFPTGMAGRATHVALVESLTGTAGKVRYVWALDSMPQAAAGESVQFPVDSTLLGW